LPIEPDD